MSREYFSKKICVIGLGYIGLPTASILATKGYSVLGVDINKNKVETINEGKIHIIEPELDILIKSAVQSGNLKASLKPDKADIFIIAVPTPLKKNREPNLKYLKQAAETISPVLKSGNLVILESTSPVGTTKKISLWIKKKRGEIDDLFFAHCPERVLPGFILKELIQNDRIVGGLTKQATIKAKEFYLSFVKGEVFETDAKMAEMAKLTENSFRDINIAFANELSMICDDLNIDVWKLIALSNRHPRVNILKPGSGVGGHCIAVDPWFIVSKSPKNAKLIKTARIVNDSKIEWVLNKIVQSAKKIKKPIIGCLGLSYKNDIDDTRESPALKIVQKLKEKKTGKLLVCEPNIKEKKFEGFILNSLEKVVKEANIIALLVNHKEFLKLDKKQLKGKIVVDTRGFKRHNE